jgi:hypothetical protein
VTQLRTLGRTAMVTLSIWHQLGINKTESLKVAITQTNGHFASVVSLLPVFSWCPSAKSPPRRSRCGNQRHQEAAPSEVSMRSHVRPVPQEGTGQQCLERGDGELRFGPRDIAGVQHRPLPVTWPLPRRIRAATQYELAAEQEVILANTLGKAVWAPRSMNTPKQTHLGNDAIFFARAN